MAPKGKGRARSRSRSRSPRHAGTSASTPVLITPNNFNKAEVQLALTDRAAVLPVPVAMARDGFDNLGGIRAIAEELKEAINLATKGKIIFNHLGVNSKRNFLLTGQSGVGKTTTGRAALAYANSYPDMRIAVFEVESEDTTLLANIFYSAKLLQPSLIFMDNLDRRSCDESSWEICLNSQLDKLSSQDTVFVLAIATSARDVRESFLTPWRFSRVIEIPLPDAQARTEILQKVMVGWSGVTDAIVQPLCTRASGWTVAELTACCSAAAEIATRRCNPQLLLHGVFDVTSLRQVQLTKEDFEQALISRV